MATPADSAPKQQLQMVWPAGRPAPEWSLTSDYRLRQFRPEDEPEYVRLMSAAGFSPWTHARIADLLRKVLPEGFFVIEHEPTRRLVATATAQHLPADLHPFGGELGWVAGDPGHKGKGLGFAVCSAAVRRLLNAGYSHIYLLTDDERLPALRIYLKMGFVPFLHMADMEGRWRAVCAQLGQCFESIAPIRVPFVEPPRPARKVQWELMHKHELDAALADSPVCYLSFGLCEPHGLYNAVGLDELKAYNLCLRVARETGGIVAPPSFWHQHEDNWLSNNWLKRVVSIQPTYMTSIPSDFFLRLYLYQLRACVNAGARAIVAVTGHYGGPEYFMKACTKLFQKHAAALPIWALADHEVIDYRDAVEDYRGSHAGVCETSQLMALCPGLSQIRGAHVQPSDPFAGGDLAPVQQRASRELGEQIVGSQARNLVAGVRQMLAAAPKTPLPPISMPEMAIICDRIQRDAPKGFWLMQEQELNHYWDSTVRPFGDRVRALRGRLPRYVFPNASMEEIE